MQFHETKHTHIRQPLVFSRRKTE